MTPLDLPSSDPRLASWLLAYDEALAAGKAGEAPPPPTDLPDATAIRDALELLEQLWPRQSPPTQVRLPAAITRIARHDDIPAESNPDALTLIMPPVSNSRASPGDSFHGSDRIGRFLLLRELGRGGCGIVHLAFDPLLGRRLALKVPRPEFVYNSEMRGRFLREARAAAAGSEHPHVVPVYEAAEIGPITYIAAMYCEGPTLANWIKTNRRIDPVLAAKITAALADAVHATHRRGVIHRDLKPSNVLLQHVNEVDTGSSLTERGLVTFPHPGFPYIPRITDFGMARLHEGFDGETPNHSILGTPDYMAPEQAAGRLRDICAATDVYALGVLLYELLTGELPIKGETERETLNLVQSVDPTSIRQRRPEISRDLEAVCLKCLAKEPHRRYRTASDLADDLMRYLEGRTTLARPTHIGERAYRWARRRPTLAALMATTTFAIFALLILWAQHTVMLGQTLEMLRASKAEAERERIAARQHSYAADLRVALQAWRSGDLERAITTLKPHRPVEGDLLRPGDFAYRFAWQLCHSERHCFAAQAEDAVALAWHPNGEELAAGYADGSIRFWDTRTGLARVLTGHQGDVNAIAFRHNGRQLLSVGDDGTLRQWDVSQGRDDWHLAVGTGKVLALAITPDGTKAATGGTDNQVRLWDLASRTTIATLPATNIIEALTFSGDGQSLLVGSRDSHLRIWNVADQQLRLDQPTWLDQMTSLAISPNDQIIAAGGRTGAIRLWRLETTANGPWLLHELASLTGHTNVVDYLTFAPDGQTLVSVSKDATIRLWDMANIGQARIWHGHTGRVWKAVYSPDGTTIATAGSDGRIRCWDRHLEQPAQRLPGIGYVTALAPCPDGKVLLVCHERKAVMLWEPGEPLRPWYPEAARRLAVGGDIAVLGFDDGRVVVLSLSDQRQRASLLVHAGGVTAVAVAPDGRTFATSGHDGVTRLWDESGQVLRILANNPDVTNRSLAWSPNGQFLAFADGPTVRVWDQVRQQVVRRLPHNDILNALVWTPDSVQLIGAGQQNGIYIWNTSENDATAVLHGHERQPLALAVDPTGRVVVSAGDDLTLRIWDLATRQELASFVTPSGPTHTLAFVALKPDDWPVLISGGDGVFVWPTAADRDWSAWPP